MARQDWTEIQERLLAGDRAAVLQVNRLVSRVLGQLRAWDFAGEWDDLRQEVLLALVSNAQQDRLRDPRAFEGYVRIITRNKFFDRLSLSKRHHERDTQAWEDENQNRVPPRGSLEAGWEDDPEANAAGLRSEVEHMGEPDRSLLLGTYWAGHTVQEMADTLGLPLGTAKRYQRRALDHLRRRLSEAGLS
ncbi:MAG: RNA polymerase sigma factor [Candidatus Binatia bacterium]|nr:RNA polymerase sigma factor [Candidatus Binatia bacterium]